MSNKSETFPNPFEVIAERLAAIEKLLIERIPQSKPAEKQPAYMTASEAAAYLRMAKQTLYSLHSQGKISALKKRKAILFRQADLDKWLSEPQVRVTRINQ